MQTYIPFSRIIGFAATVACSIIAGVLFQNAYFAITGIAFCAILGAVTLKRARP